MDLKLFASTFVAIFLAELGDKTQLAVLTLSSSSSGGASSARWMVFAGSALALVSTSAIAVLGGEAIGKLVSPVLLKRLAGIAFVVMGVWFIWTSAKGD